MINDSSLQGVAPRRRIEGILFDVGGVLVTDMIDKKIRDLAARHSVPLDRMLRTRWELRVEADRGHVSDPGFWQQVLQEVGVAAGPADLEIESYMHAIEGTLDIVRELKEIGLKLGILSNDSVEMGATGDGCLVLMTLRCRHHFVGSRDDKTEQGSMCWPAGV